MAERMRRRFKLSELTDEQLLDLFNDVETDEELLNNSSDDDEDSLDLVESLNTALEDAETISFIDNTADNVKDNVQELEITKNPAKRPRSPLPIKEYSVCTSEPFSGGFNCADVESINKVPTKVTWRQQSIQLHVNDIAFRGDSSLPDCIKELKHRCRFSVTSSIQRL
ncbi:uncharacterized protein [Drosophila kikkawai]|uniref:PiggyBac transposable element-derived protein domain-containing protein n=1 Tax=Drosophila kikkawai TaxID=30033 RepID=A0ABM3C8F0_DROKI|nr:uncharacterized protein LOC121503177 [Drosophila kikkawai]XP_041633315.1 uncharacterized protein LOC121503177 [Drosophila kikkawai]